MTEVWFRNPSNYIKELVECGVGKMAWDRGLLVKKSLDPDAYASLYFGRAIPWEALVIGDQGTAHIDADHPMSAPIAVYPTFMYGENPALLEELVEQPIGQDKDLCSDTSVPADERPVYGQEHRIIITELPKVTSGPAKKFIAYLKEIQESYPDVKFHIHATYSYRIAFGMGFYSGDVEPRMDASKGRVILPSGRIVSHEQTVQNAQWVTVLGFRPVELAIPRNRCMFNIKSALWAGANFDTLYNFKAKKSKTDVVDLTSSDADHKPATTPSHMMHRTKPKEGDKFHCNTCSLAMDCKYQRDGAVCTVPGAEPVELAKFFRTRDSDSIIDGLGILMQASSRRLEAGLAEEEDFGLNPEVTKMLNQLFEQGVKLAKLINPALTKPSVQVNVGGGAAATVSAGNPRQFVAAAVNELKRQGIPAEKITTKMIENLINGMGDADASRRSISGTVLASQTEVDN